ncbi:chp (predicted) [Pycnogonum litorale]
MFLFLVLLLLSDGSTGEEYHSPCTFNPLCTCSKSGPDLGEVRCHDIPFTDIPRAVNETQMFVFSMSNNDLRSVSGHSLYGTGTYKLEIIDNKITTLDEYVFSGMERSLWQVDLKNNRLMDVPVFSLSKLHKLRLLDLSGNLIASIRPSDFQGKHNGIQKLFLNGNSIKVIGEGTFRRLGRCEELDLSSNYISNVHEMSLPVGNKLKRLNLADNLLNAIPFAAVSKLDGLQSLNLAQNQISQTFDVLFEKTLSLDTLVLDENEISVLSPFAFQNFNSLNKTSISKNPLVVVKQDAFKDAKIKEIRLSENYISEIPEGVFNGLEETLQALNLSNNDLSFIAPGAFRQFDELRTLDLTGNKLRLDLDEIFNGSRYTIQHLYLGGQKMTERTFDDLRDIRNLRTLALSSLPGENLGKNDFAGVSLALKTIRLNRNAIGEIKAGAFYHMPGVSVVDFSNNVIANIDDDSFTALGSSVEELRLSNSLSMETFPYVLFDKMTNLKVLDVSSNDLAAIPTESFKTMPSLTTIDLSNNRITEVQKGLFDSHHNGRLGSVNLAVNNIVKISSRSFRDLENLRELNLQDNDVASIDGSSFVNLNEIRTIDFGGNKLARVSPESFQNLPKLERLSFSNNRLKELNLAFLDQVGTLSDLLVDFSLNSIENLLSPEIGGGSTLNVLPIKSLNFSRNNISEVHESFFEPIRNSLTTLDLSRNRIVNVTGETFGKLQHLQLLDMNDNNIELVSKDAFFGFHRVQILKMNRNRVAFFDKSTFSGKFNLRILDVSRNLVTDFKDETFEDPSLEILDVSHNRISRMPVEALLRSNSSLSYLNLSFNRLRYVARLDFKHLTKLIRLGLDGNNIVEIAADSFANLPNLLSLDLSHNPLDKVTSEAFSGIRDHLEELNIANISIRIAPELGMPRLLDLNVSANRMKVINATLFRGLDNLRRLDLSGNKFTSVDKSNWRQLPRLASLDVSDNAVTKILNDSFEGLDGLQELNIQALPISFFDQGALANMPKLTTLSVDSYEKVEKLRFQKLTSNNGALRTINVEVAHRNFYDVFDGQLPRKLSTVIITGTKLRSLAHNLLRGLRSRHLRLVINGTGIKNISWKLFLNLGEVRTLDLDVRNNELTTMGRPYTTQYRGEVGRVFLNGLRLANNDWKCGCNIGWIEDWLRQSLPDCDRCHDLLADLRRTKCRNLKNRSLIDAVKHVIDCDANKSNNSSMPSSQLIVLIAVILINGKLEVSRRSCLPS